MIESQPYAEPIARVAGVRARLGRDDAALRRREADWSEVEGAVADAFAQMARDVAIRLPDARSRAGANSSGAMLLYAYRVFDLPGRPDTEPVVVGVSLKRVEGGIDVRGDICEEDSGRLLLSSSSWRHRVPDHPDRVLLVGSDVASRLARGVDALVEILNRPDTA